MANETAEKLRRMAFARAKTPHVFLSVARDYEVLSMEAVFMNEAADLIDAQERKIERLERIVAKFGASDRG